MQTNNQKINALRSDITAQIVALMKNNNLKEVEFIEEELDDPTYVLWADNDGEWSESIVKKVSLCGEGIELHCDDEHGKVDIESHELACNHLGWLENIRQNILQALEITDTSAVDSGELIRLRDQSLTARDSILKEMYTCVKAIPNESLKSKECYQINDEDGDLCYIRGFEIKGNAVQAVLEYEPDFNERRINVGSLDVEALLGIMLSMLE